MSQTAAPNGVPILGRGKHRTPARGACFMEYTSVLAGEPFGDAPACVDPELAAVLRGANDRLSDVDRRQLLPLLGRAIGLAIEPPPRAKRRWWLGTLRTRPDEDSARYAALTARLHRAVAAGFTAAVERRPAAAGQQSHRRPPRLERLFWDLMEAPFPATTSQDYVSRLIARLDLLHAFYEQALQDLHLSRSTLPAPAEVAGAGLLDIPVADVGQQDLDDPAAAPGLDSAPEPT